MQQSPTVITVNAVKSTFDTPVMASVNTAITAMQMAKTSMVSEGARGVRRRHEQDSSGLNQVGVVRGFIVGTLVRHRRGSHWLAAACGRHKQCTLVTQAKAKMGKATEMARPLLSPMMVTTWSSQAEL